MKDRQHDGEVQARVHPPMVGWRWPLGKAAPALYTRVMDGLAALPVAGLIAWGYQRARRAQPVWAPRVLVGLVVAALAWVGAAYLRPAPALGVRVWVERAAVDDVFAIGDRHVVRLAVAEPAACADGDARGVQALLDRGVDAQGLARADHVDALIRVASSGCGLVRYTPNR